MISRDRFNSITNSFTDKNILVVATKQDTAKNLVTKVRVMHQNLPSWVKAACVEDNKLSLRYKNGSQIKAVSATEDAGRSEALSLLILDDSSKGFVKLINSFSNKKRNNIILIRNFIS